MSIADPRILVVEDEGRMRDLLVSAIGGWGFSATGVRSGEESLRAMQGETFEIVLLDLNLPGMSGMECFEAIHERWPGTAVIILTGFGDLEAAKQAIRLGVVEFLTKPCHLGELEQAIGRAKLRLMGNRMPPSPVPAPPPAPAAPAPAAESATTLEELERQHILSALARHGGNRAATAAELGISLRTLYYRLAEYQQQGHVIDPKG